MIKRWPLPRVVRPTVSSLISTHIPDLPPLPPLDPKLVADSEENAKQLKDAYQVLHSIEEQYEKVCNDLEGLEKGNRWNNRSNRDSRIKQLNASLEELKKKKEVAKKIHDTILKEGENIIAILTSHKILEESYEKIAKMQEEL